MAVICRRLPNFKIRMHHSSAGSTGILKASDYISEEEESECVAKITPPKGYGVIYHVEGMELRRDANNDCRDYIKIYNETSRSNMTSPVCRDCCHFSRSDQVCQGHCGYESDGLICDEFCDKTNETFVSTGTGLTLAVHYHTRCGTCTAKKEEVGFRMVFTAYKLHAGHDASCGLSSEFKCDNGRCIWSGLTCDGYNNCGDMSDENKNGNSHCAEFPDPIKAVIVASAVIVTVLLGVVLAYFPKMSLHRFFGQKKKTSAFRISHHKRPPPLTIIKKKPSHSRTVSFQTPLPQIKEISVSDSEV